MCVRPAVRPRRRESGEARPPGGGPRSSPSSRDQRTTDPLERTAPVGFFLGRGGRRRRGCGSACSGRRVRGAGAGPDPRPPSGSARRVHHRHRRGPPRRTRTGSTAAPTPTCSPCPTASPPPTPRSCARAQPGRGRGRPLRRPAPPDRRGLPRAGTATTIPRPRCSAAPYGLTEVFADRIRAARLVANPGCYATSVLLPLLPLLRDGLVDGGDVVVDAKSGTTGRGPRAARGPALLARSPTTSPPTRPGRAHRHVGEMEAVVEQVTGQGDRDDLLPAPPAREARHPVRALPEVERRRGRAGRRPARVLRGRAVRPRAPGSRRASPTSRGPTTAGSPCTTPRRAGWWCSPPSTTS